MSISDFTQSKAIAKDGYSFRAIIMAAIAMTTNPLTMAKLQASFPDMYEEWKHRCLVPNGAINSLESSWVEQLAKESNE